MGYLLVASLVVGVVASTAIGALGEDDPTPTESASPSPAATVSPEPSPSPTATPSPTETTPAEPSPSPASPSPTEPSVAEGPTVAVTVRFRPGVRTGEAAESIAAVRGTPRSSIPALRLEVIEVPEADLSAVLTDLADDPWVETVEVDRARELTAVDDADYPSQWALPAIGWDEVVGSTAELAPTRIAVLDTGVDAGHPDLAGRIGPSYAAVDGANPQADPNGHGTSMAAIAAATTGNGIGIAGVAYDGATILPVTVLGADGVGWDSDIIEGVVWAADQGADVILLAFSAPGFSEHLQDAISYAWSRGAVVVAAAGNDASPAPTYPAGLADVVGVGATGADDTRWSGSNHGPAVFLAAPGVGISDGTGTVTGTSASAAITAGAAAVLRGEDPTASNAVVVGRLARNAAPAGSTADTGNGRLDLARAVSDSTSDPIRPAGVAGSGGPYVGPYEAAATFTSTQPGGNWNDPTTWGGAGVPTAGDAVVIADLSHTVTIPSGYAASAASLELAVTSGSTSASSTLALADATSSLSVTGDVDVTHPKTAGITHLLSIGAGTVTVGGSLDIGNADGIDNTAVAKVSLTTGSLTVNGGLAAKGRKADDAVLEVTSTGTVTVSGAVSVADSDNQRMTTSLATTSTFVFAGSVAQTIPIDILNEVTFGNLHVTNTAGATVNNEIKSGMVNGNLRVLSGGLLINNKNRDPNGAAGKVFEVGANSTYRLLQDVDGLAAGFTVDLHPDSTVEYARAGDQKVYVANYGGLKTSGSGTKTAQGNLTLTGGLTISSGTTFDLDGRTLAIAGALVSTGTFTHSGGTVDFNGTGTQTIPALQYHNLTSSSTGARILASSGTIGITGTFTPGTNSYTSTGSTVSYNLDNNQTVAAFAHYYNLTLANKGTKTLPGSSLSVTGNFTMTGQATTTANAAMDIGGNFTLTTTDNDFAAGSFTHHVGGDFSIVANQLLNGGGFSPGTSTFDFDGAGPQTLTSTSTYSGIPTILFHHVTFNGAGEKTSMAALGTSGDLTINSPSTLSTGYAIATTADNRTVTVANGATLELTGTQGMAITTATGLTKTFGATSTVNYAGTNQTVSSETYGHLTLSGSGTKTMPASAMTVAGNLTTSGTASATAGAAVTISGNLDVGSGSTFNAGAFTHNVAGNFVRAGTFGAGTSTMNFNGAAAQSIASATFYNLTFNGDGTKTAGGALTINGDLTINSPSTLSTGSAITLANGKTFTVASGATFELTGSQGMVTAASGSITKTFGATSTVNYAGTGSQTIAAEQYGNLISSSTGARTLAGSGTIGIAGTFTPGSNTYTVTGSTVSFNSSSAQTIPAFNYHNLTSVSTGARTLAGSGTIGIAGTFTPGSNTYTVTGSTVSFNSSSAQTIPSFTYGSLTAAGSGTKTAGGDLTVGSTLTVTLSSTLDAGSSTHRVDGDLNLYGTFTAGTSTVDLRGATAQTLTANDPVTFSSLKIDGGSATPQLTIGVDTTVNGTLTLGARRLDTGSNTLIIGSSGTVSNTGNGFVAGNLRKTLGTGSSVNATFEVGTDSAYTPASLTFSSITTGGTLTASSTASQHPQHATSGLSTTYYVDRYWTLTAGGGLAFADVDVTLTFVAGDLEGNPDTSSLQIRRYATSAWTNPGAFSSTATTVTATDVTGLGEFAAGEIQRESQTITFGSLSDRTYGDDPVTVSATASSGLTVTFSSTTTSVCTSGGPNGATITLITAGTCTVKATQSGDEQYEPTSVQQSFTVAQRTLTVSATGQNKTYDGTDTASVALSSDEVSGDTLTLSYTTATFASADVGTHTVTVTGIQVSGTDAGNYTLAATSTTTTADITAKSISGSFTADNKTYDGTTAATVATRSLSGLESGDTVSLSGGTATFASADVGTHTVTLTGASLTGADGGNYTLGSVATTSADITIRTLAVTATAADKAYDGTDTATVTLGSDKVSGDTLTLSNATATFASAGVGTHTVTVTGIQVSGDDASNYSLAATTTTTTADITAKALTGSFSADDKTYDGTTAATVATRSLSGVVGSEDVTLSGGTATFASADVGTHTVTLSGASLTGADAGNYTLGSVATTSADITTRTLTVTATAADKTYDGTDTATVTFSSDKIAGDTLTISSTTATFASPDVGTGIVVSVTGIQVSGDDAANYTLASTSDTDTADITTASLTITAEDKEMLEGKPRPAFTATYTGFVAGEDAGDLAGTLTCSVAESDPLTLGTYDIVCSGKSSTNYTITYVDGTLTVTDKFTVVVSWDAPPDIVYGTALSNTQLDATASYDGQPVAGTFTYDPAVGAVLDAGSRTLSVTFTPTDTTTYASKTASVQITVTAKPLTAGFTVAGKTYDGSTTAAVTSRSLSGAIAGDDVVLTGGTAAFADANAGSQVASLTGATLTGADAGNYSLGSVATTTATISTRPVTGSFTAADKVYDGTTAATVTARTIASGVVNGDDVVLSGGSATFSTSNVGTDRTVRLSGATLAGDDASNYHVASVSSTSADITLRGLVITANDTTRVYGAPNPAFTVRYAGLAPADTSDVLGGTLSVTTTAAISAAAGTTWSVVPRGLTSQNYDITFVAGRLTIEKAETRVSVATSSNPSTASGTLTATVTIDVVPPGSGTPGGTVRLLVDGPLVYGPTPLPADGRATFGLEGLGQGTYALTASYSGSSNFRSATSGDLEQRVQSAATPEPTPAAPDGPSAPGTAGGGGAIDDGTPSPTPTTAPTPTPPSGGTTGASPTEEPSDGGSGSATEGSEPTGSGGTEPSGPLAGPPDGTFFSDDALALDGEQSQESGVSTTTVVAIGVAGAAAAAVLAGLGLAGASAAGAAGAAAGAAAASAGAGAAAAGAGAGAGAAGTGGVGGAAGSSSAGGPVRRLARLVLGR